MLNWPESSSSAVRTDDDVRPTSQHFPAMPARMCSLCKLKAGSPFLRMISSRIVLKTSMNSFSVQSQSRLSVLEDDFLKTFPGFLDEITVQLQAAYFHATPRHRNSDCQIRRDHCKNAQIPSVNSTEELCTLLHSMQHPRQG